MNNFRYFKLILCLLILLIFGCGPKKPSLHVYSWANYFKPSLLTQFEKEFGCHVVVDTFDTNEAMYAKLKAGASGYDLIIPTSYLADIMINQGMLRKLDHNLVPNLKYLDTEYAKLYCDLNLEYRVPYMSGYAGIAYRKDKLPQLEPSWDVFGRKDLRGRMTMLNDTREVIGAALKFLNYSINTVNPQEIDEATKQAILWKGNLAKFESEQYTNGIASAEYLVSQGYSTDSMQVIRENDLVGFLFPIQGTIIGIDHFAIPNQAHEVELAHQFINFFYTPSVSAENMEYLFATSPNKEGIALLSPSFRENPLLFPPIELLQRSEWIKNLGQHIKLYQQAWDKIKASKVES